MNYLAITLNTTNQELLSQVKQLLSTYKNSFSRSYKSQIKFEGSEKKKWTYCFFAELPQNDSEHIKEFLTKLSPELKQGIIRVELMVLTPNSFLQKNPRKQGMTIIEHVDVQENYLQDFQHIMINNNTPAMKYIIEKKQWCYEFIALETVEIIYHNTDYSPWNQIHLIDMAISGAFRYKKDFNEGLQLVNAPDFETNFNHLKSIREFTYKFKSKLI